MASFGLLGDIRFLCRKYLSGILMIKITTANSVTTKVNKEITANHDINSWCVFIHPEMAANSTIGQPFDTEIVQAAFHVDLQSLQKNDQWERHPCVDGDKLLYRAQRGDVKPAIQIGNVLVLVSEKGKGYLIGEFRRNPIKEVPQCRKQVRRLPM